MVLDYAVNTLLRQWCNVTAASNPSNRLDITMVEQLDGISDDSRTDPSTDALWCFILAKVLFVWVAR